MGRPQLNRRPGGLIRHASRDANEPEIINALHRAGADVYQLDGRDIPDLMVGFRQKWTVLEVKTEEGELRPGQETFFMLAEAQRLPAFVVRTPEEALRAIGAIL